MTAREEAAMAERVSNEILDKVSDVLEQAMGRNPLADKAIALAKLYESYDGSTLVGPHSVAARLRELAGEVDRG